MRLHVPYNTLAHITGHYEKSLWLKLDVVRDELGLVSPGTSRQAFIDGAPGYLKTAVAAFMGDNPNYKNNCFLIMPFGETEFHEQMVKTLKHIMDGLGFNLLRADDKYYTDDVPSNVETYMNGCSFALAVYERVTTDAHNPNVSFEVGYMRGHKKPVCLLKERTVEKLPSDLEGMIYVEFDQFALEPTLKNGLVKWLSDKGLLRNRDRYVPRR